jgi:REP element-mobilizing transposase RayT
MARKLRVEYPGAVYHVMNRGDRREEIFKDDKDRERFLETLGEVCVKTGWQVHAFCLMGNHFHLVVETPQGNLVAGMKWFLGTYTSRFNRRHKLFGHLFSGRYKALIVDGSGHGYLKTVCDYVHLNPARAGLVTAAAFEPVSVEQLAGILEASRKAVGVAAGGSFTGRVSDSARQRGGAAGAGARVGGSAAVGAQ